MIRHIDYSDYNNFIKLINININTDTYNLFISNLNPNRHIIVLLT